MTETYDIRLICAGRIKEPFFREGLDFYRQKICGCCRFEIVECADEPTPDSASAAEEDRIRDREGERILGKVRDGAYVIALCIEGDHHGTEEWKRIIRRQAARTQGRVDLIIGGSLGLSRAVVTRADKKLSFSGLTFPHQMMRLILCQQLAEWVREEA